MKTLISTTLALALTSCSAAYAQSSRNCGPREVVISHLQNKYKESRQFMGIAANNSILEAHASTETGTWTITVTTPNGVTCLVASGQNFERLDESISDDDT